MQTRSAYGPSRNADGILKPLFASDGLNRPDEPAVFRSARVMHALRPSRGERDWCALNGSGRGFSLRGAQCEALARLQTDHAFPQRKREVNPVQKLDMAAGLIHLAGGD